MKYFLVKATKPKDSFYFQESGDHIFFYCRGFDDLKKTMRCISPKFIRTRSGRWFFNRMSDGHLVLLHPLLKTKMFEIKLVGKMQVEKQVNYTNGHNYTHLLKTVSDVSAAQSF